MNKMCVGVVVAMATAGSACAQSYSEGFDSILPAGWAQQNLSTTIGTTNWFQGNDTVFPAQAGAPTSYIGANFNNTTGAGTISNWLFAPTSVLNNGDTFSFYTRTVSSPAFPDRLELRLSTSGSSVNAGATPTSVGVFNTLLLSVNPTLSVSGYPNAWTQYSVTLSGLPSGGVSGRLAFRYFVTSGGPSGANSDYIGIDTVQYTSVPAPAGLAVIGLGGLAAGRRRR